jgi:hypothetical protein
MTTRILNFDNGSKNHEENDFGHDLNLLTSHTYCKFHILREAGVDCREKSVRSKTPLTLPRFNIKPSSQTEELNMSSRKDDVKIANSTTKNEKLEIY